MKRIHTKNHSHTHGCLWHTSGLNYAKIICGDCQLILLWGKAVDCEWGIVISSWRGSASNKINKSSEILSERPVLLYHFVHLSRKVAQ